MQEDMSFKQFISLFRSMRFGLILLGILCVLAVIGSTIPQGQSEAFYRMNFSEGRARLLMGLGFTNIYTSLYFRSLFLALCINLTLCSIIRFKGILKRATGLYYNKAEEKIESLPIKGIEKPDSFIEEKFSSWGYAGIKKLQEEQRTIYYSKRLSIGYFGSWLIHLGLLIVIIAYSFGQYKNFSAAVYGIPGSVQEIGDTGLRAAIRDFRIEFEENGAVKQYYTQLEVLDQEGTPLDAGLLYVNSPFRYKGYSFYQTATGWATEVKAFKSNDAIGEQLLYEGTTYMDEAEGIALQFNRLYPDFINTASGMATASQLPNNPQILYSLFYQGSRVDMNVVSPGEVISWQEYQFILDDINRYTYLQVNKIPGKAAALCGALIIMLGLYVAFYLKPRHAVAVVEGDSLSFYGHISARSKNVFKGVNTGLGG